MSDDKFYTLVVATVITIFLIALFAVIANFQDNETIQKKYDTCAHSGNVTVCIEKAK